MPAKKRSLTVLTIGDINGKIGRRAVAALLPGWRKKYKPDVVVANAENIAHGIGVTRSTLAEATTAGVDVFTSGNHVFSKPEGVEILNEPDSILIRPANYPLGNPGVGVKKLTVGTTAILVFNLQGQVFMEEQVNNPFRAFDELYGQHADEKTISLVDFHAEATSEKVGFGWYAAGRAQAVWGTHTHVQTADERILDGGTAYITDLGMAGERDSVIGVNRKTIIHNFLAQSEEERLHHDIAETGWAIVEGAVITIDPAARQATAIERLRQTVEVR